MSYKVIKQLPDIDELLKDMQLSENGKKSVKQNRLEIENILSGKDDRMLLIVGPCSAWPNTAVLEYAKRLANLTSRVEHKMKLVMRTYIQKPRTIKGWTGPVNQPDPLLPPDIEKGIKYCHKLMVDVVEMGLPIADEALFTHNARGFLELLSWVAIGARSGEDQEHRIFASSLDLPVGIKNPTHGSLKIGVNSIVAAQHQHVAVFDGYEVETDGNPYAHLVLRGGAGKPNYDVASIEEARQHLLKNEVVNPAVIVDVSHDNCLINGKKDHMAQVEIIKDVIKNVRDVPELRQVVKGFMLESFILPGNQNIETVENCNLDGLSITDPCLGWDDTEKLILELADIVVIQKRDK